MFAEVFLILAEISWLSIGIVLGGCFLIASLLNEEEPGAATVTLGAVAVLLSGLYIYNHSLDEFIAMFSGWRDYIPYAFAYLAAGAVWSVVKWASYIRKAVVELKDSIEDVKLLWESKLDGTRTMYEKYVGELCSVVNKHTMNLSENNLYAIDLLNEHKNQLTVPVILKKIKLSAGKKKAIITAWIAYWPISICSVFLQEFIVGIVDNVFKMMRGIYNR